MNDPLEPPGQAPTFTLVSPGIFRYGPTGGFYERPTIDGRRTWRALQATTLRLAKAELAAKRTDASRASLGLAKDPYAKSARVGDILRAYQAAGYPDKWGQRRAARTEKEEAWRLSKLIPEFDRTPVEEINFSRLRRYGAGLNAPRLADLMVYTLNNAFVFARKERLITANPITERPRFVRKSEVVHCRERMPADCAELWNLADWFFARPQTIGGGFRMLLEAYTGLRTSEALALRMDATSPPTPGLIQGDKLWVARAKSGSNPWAQVHPELQSLIAAHHAWHQANHAGNPWWFPHRDDQTAAAWSQSLTKSLALAAKACGTPPRTSHGLRAFYVTVRRSQGIGDGQIAAEIGDRTGASIIETTYGQIPPNWQGGPGLAWSVPDREAPWNRAF